MILRAVILAIAVSLAVPSLAAGAPSCGAFFLTGGEKTINLVDNPPKGLSIGDVRAGSRALLGADGSPVADVRFVATVTATATARHGSVLASQYFITFDDGWIATQSVYELADATDTSQRAGDAVLLVTGGMGAFRNARGTVTLKAGDPPTYVFDLTCK